MKVSIFGIGTVNTLGLDAQSFDFTKEISKVHKSKCCPKGSPKTISQTILSTPDFQSHPLLSQRGVKFLTRGSQQLLIASMQALEDTSTAEINSNNLGVAIGTNYASLEVISNYDWTTIAEGPSFVSVMDIPNTLLNAPASQVAIKQCAKAFNSTISTGRCASLDAIGYALSFLQLGRGQYALAGGVEELNPSVLWQLNTQTRFNQSDYLFGEAAGVVLLGTEGKSTYQADLVGWANFWDPRAPLKEVVREAVEEALRQAQLTSKDLGIVAMGVYSAEDQDLIDGVQELLNPSHKVKAFSLSSLIGDVGGVSGALHLIATVLAYKNSLLPPTAHVEGIDWRDSFEVSTAPSPIEPAPALIVDLDSLGGASALIVVP